MINLSEEDRDGLFEMSHGKLVKRKFDDFNTLQLAQLCSNPGLLPVTVPMREGGIDYDEQASLYTEMNEALVELLNKTQAKNQNLIRQILKESPS